MLPVLSLNNISGQTAMHTAPYSLQHTVTYSQAFSMNPSGLHVFGCTALNSDNYINQPHHYKNMQTEENDGGYVNLKKWEPIIIKRKSDSRGRFHIGQKYFGMDIRVFVSDYDIEPEKCKKYMLFPEPVFKEIRKSRIKDKIGELITVQKSGDVWMGKGNKNKFIKAFVKVR